MGAAEEGKDAQPVAGPSQTYPPSPAAPSADSVAGIDALPDDAATPATEAAQATTLTPAMLVRRNVFFRVLGAMNDMGTNKRIWLLFKGGLVLAQIVTFIAILGVTSGKSCDKPLRVYLALHVTRIALSFPLSLYQSLAPPRPPRNETQTPESIARREARRVMGSPATDERVKLFSDLFSCCALILFVVGNWWWWTSSSCQRDAGLLYWASLAALCFGWVYVVEVALIVFAVVFFLPVVILLLRAFGVGQKKNEVGPMSQSLISQIPLVLYIPGPEQPIVQPNAQAESEKPTPNEPSTEPPAPVRTSTAVPALTSTSPKSKKRRRFASLFLRGRAKSKSSSFGSKPSSGGSAEGYVAAPHPYHPLPPNLAACPICLTDFEEPPKAGTELDLSTYEWEPLRLLPCGHCLHKECLDPWLEGSSGRCPVCQRPVGPTSSKGKRRSRSATGASSASTPVTPAPVPPGESAV